MVQLEPTAVRRLSGGDTVLDVPGFGDGPAVYVHSLRHALASSSPNIRRKDRQGPAKAPGRYPARRLEYLNLGGDCDPLPWRRHRWCSTGHQASTITDFRELVRVGQPTHSHIASHVKTGIPLRPNPIHVILGEAVHTLVQKQILLRPRHGYTGRWRIAVLGGRVDFKRYDHSSSGHWARSGLRQPVSGHDRSENTDCSLRRVQRSPASHISRRPCWKNSQRQNS